MSPFIGSIRTEIRTWRYSLQTEIERFLSHLALNRQVSAATQNQALCALIFMYRHVIGREIVGLSYSLTKTPRRMPTVLNADEARIIIGLMKGKYKLITALLYGSGLRINEALQLRIKDVDFNQRSIFVFRGKGGKDQYTILPRSLI